MCCSSNCGLWVAKDCHRLHSMSCQCFTLLNCDSKRECYQPPISIWDLLAPCARNSVVGPTMIFMFVHCCGSHLAVIWVWSICPLHQVLSMGPGNLPVFWDWTTNTGRFSSRPIQKHDLLPLGRSIPDPYPSTQGYCADWQDPLVPISGIGLWVSLFIAALRYATVDCKRLRLVRHWVF